MLKWRNQLSYDEDRIMNNIEKEINGFDEQQKIFKLMNKVKKQSLDYNPLFFHYIARRNGGS